MSTWSAAFVTSFGLLALPGTGVAQLRYQQGLASQLTVEGFGNFTAGAQTGASIGGPHADAWRFDGAVRLLERLKIAGMPDIGVRVVAQRSPENGVQISEASLLLFGQSGRFEVGKRMGLPDVLTGYAPNSFTFTNAEFGPHSGPSLDPGGGLQTAFLATGIRRRVEALTPLGFTALIADDESPKVLYVSPRRNGFLAGVSFAPDATDPRFKQLVQAGLVHERYWEQNVLRWGGSYSFARGGSTGPNGAVRDLHSLNLGVATTLHDSLTLGLSATYDGGSGCPTTD
jgi:Gram-negative porin